MAYISNEMKSMTNYLLHILVALISLVPTTQSGTTTCNDNWIRYGESCYSFRQNAVPWFDARANCWAEGATMVVIDDRFELSFVSSFLENAGDGSNYWLGASRYQLWPDDHNQFFWFWDDTRPVATLDYWLSEPTSSTNHNCLETRRIVSNNEVTRRWVQQNCYLRRRYICEKNTRYVMLKLPASNSVASLSCNGNNLLRLHTWKVGPDWANEPGISREWCPFENEALDNHNKPSAAYKRAVTACDGYPRCRFNFHPFNTWDSCGSGVMVSYVIYTCHKPVVCPDKETIGDGAEEWVRYEDMCYGSHRDPHHYTSFQLAESECNKHRLGHLLSLFSAEETTFLKRNHLSHHVDRLGARYDRNSRTWVYTNGLAVDWHPLSYYHSQPDGCLYIKDDQRITWFIASCNYADASFICKVPNQDCVKPLGLENREIRDNMITASSMITAATSPPQARLNGPSAWCAHTADKQPYIQIDNQLIVEIYGVQIQGFNRSYVTRFKINVSENDNQWKSVWFKYGKQIFIGNRNPYSTVTAYFRDVVQARFIRLFPTAYIGTVCIRLEILGCTLHGGWSDWSKWSQCSRSCGGGISIRTRTCTNPPPRYGGRKCEGNSEENVICKTNPCPMNGGWSCWGGWSSCSSHCGNGTRYRNRTCDNPQPAHGGEDCVGQTTETKVCIETLCEYGEAVSEYLGGFIVDGNSYVSTKHAMSVIDNSTRSDCLSSCFQANNFYCTSVYVNNKSCWLFGIGEKSPSSTLPFYVNDGVDKFLRLLDFNYITQSEKSVIHNSTLIACTNLCQTSCDGFQLVNSTCRLYDIPERQLNATPGTLFRRNCHSRCAAIRKNIYKSLISDSNNILDLSDSQLESDDLVEGLFSGLNFVIFVSLKENRLTYLPDGILDSLENLEALDLSNNKFTIISRYSFWRNKHLKYINVINNGIKTIDHLIMINSPSMLQIDSKHRIQYTFDGELEFVDGCHSGDCYSSCGEAKYIETNHHGPVIIIKKIKFNLNELSNYLVNAAVSDVRIYAQTVVMTSMVSVHFNLSIITRQFWMSQNSAFRFNYQTAVNTHLLGCKVNFVRASCQNNQFVALRYAEGSSSINIFTSEIYSPARCEEDTVPIRFPALDTDQLKLAMYCAKRLAGDTQVRRYSSRKKSPLQWYILDYVAAVTSQQVLEFMNNNGKGHLNVISQQAKKLRADWTITRDSNVHLVPHMSYRGHHDRIKNMIAILNTYDREIKHIHSNAISVDDRLFSVKTILTKAKAALDKKQREYNTLADRLKKAQLIIFKMKKEFDGAKTECDKAKNIFEGGLKKSAASDGVRLAMVFVKTVGGLVTGTGLDIGDYGAAIVEMIQTLYGLFDLLDELDKMLTLSKTLIDHMDYNGITDVDLEVIEAAAKLGIRSVIWRSLRNMVNVYLSTPKVRKIKGYHVYKRALLDYIDWGDALTMATMTHANLAREVLNKQIEKIMQRTEFEELDRIYLEAVEQQAVTNNVLHQANLEAFNYQQMALDILDEFCRSYFYYYFKWCSIDVKPSLQDSINQIAIKMNTALEKEFDDMALSCRSNPVKIHIPLTDLENVDECTYQTCPVKNLRKNHEVFVKIGLDHDKLRIYERIRVQEMRVYIDGAVTPDGEIDVTITNTGEFNDRYRFRNYTFVTSQQPLSFRYRITDGIIKEAGCLSGGQSAFFADLSPFTTWQFKIMESLNPGADLSNVTSIDMFFIGHATKTVTCQSNRVFDRFRDAHYFDYIQSGHSDLSASCQKPPR